MSHPNGTKFATITLRTGPRLHYAERGDREGEAIVFLHAFADLLLVAVHLSGVYVSVADLEGLAHRLRGLVRFDLEDPETELRDGVTVI